MILYENTVPLDDTVAIDSASPESGLLSIDMNTQVLDGCEAAQQSGDQMEDYFETEVALDSDDEGKNQNEAVNSANSSGVVGRFSRRDAVGLLRRQQAPVGYFRKLNKISERVLNGIGSAISGRSVEESTAERTGPYNDDGFQERRVVVDSVVSRSSELNYFESPLVAESQDKAMQFVDDYLSACDLGSYKDIPIRKTDVIKSPPSLRSMGTQSLAKRLTLESTASKLTTFDWAEKQVAKAECSPLRLHKDSILGFSGDRCGSVSVDQKSPNVNLHNEISILQPEEKLPGNMSSPNNSDTVRLSSNDTETIGLNSGICIVPDSMELDEQLDVGISSQNADNAEQYRLTPEESYVGLDTQMAAEAMEELVHAGPPSVDACFTHQGSDNTLLDSSNAVNDKDKSNLAGHEVSFVDWRCKEKRSKSMKISTVQDKRLSGLAAKRFKNKRGTISQPLAGKKLMTKKLMADEDTTNRRFAAPSSITLQQEEYGSTERYSSKQFQKLDRLCSRLPRKTADGIKSEPPPKGKKISCSFDEGAHRKGVDGICLRSNSGPFFELKTDSAKGKENCFLDVADTTPSELNTWVYPKGKRTRQCTSRLAISRGNRCLPFAAVDNNLEKNPTVKLNEEAVGVSKLLVYNRRRKVSLGREYTGSSLKVVVDLSSSVNNSAVPDRQVRTPFDSSAKKPLKQCDTPDNASVYMKSECSGKRKRSLSPLSRSPLMKELMRLGYTDSLPDFLPKDSRRRRATGKVCILFSQNLDTSTLKQQKKIVARFGFSIASCSSDATHFVAGRFVRTRNMLEAIGLGKPVVTHLWLEGCEQAGYVIDEKSYILRDEKKEKEIGFNMHVTLNRASQLPLLKDRRVFITPNVKAGMDVISSLVKAVQGQVVQNILKAKMKDELIHNDSLILSSEEDYTVCLQFLHKGASIYDSELLLNGIVTQKLEYERYRLFKDPKENGH